MELNFSLSRLLLLVALLVVFGLDGGFIPPDVSPDSLLDPRRVAKAWLYCVALFVSGAVSATVVDHFVGMIDRSNIRVIYIILGVALMTGAWLWLGGLRSAALPS